MIRIFPFLLQFLAFRCAAAYNGPHTLFRRMSLERGNKTLPPLFSFLLGFVWVAVREVKRWESGMIFESMLTGSRVSTPSRTRVTIPKRLPNRRVPKVDLVMLS